MSATAIRGWCPGAHRPMLSGDGLVVRVRPRLARLSADQALGLCDAALSHGSGLIDLTNRANLQIRGVGDPAYPALMGDLAALGLLDGDAETEARRNLLVDPFHTPGEPTAGLARQLAGRLGDLPPLPAKFGFALDCGPRRRLSADPADIRIESAADGGVVVRADGAAAGRALPVERAVDAAIELAVWFAGRVTPQVRRMARAVADLPDGWTGAAPAPVAAPTTPGAGMLGPVLGAAFGQAPARALANLITQSRATGIRITPWRMIVLEDGEPVDHPEFISLPDDPLLGADACAGAPFCPQAQVETRELARLLAPRTGGSLHVSGCAKGCARPGSADVTLVGRDGRFDLVPHGRSGDMPAKTGLSAQALVKMEFG